MIQIKLNRAARSLAAAAAATVLFGAGHAAAQATNYTISGGNWTTVTNAGACAVGECNTYTTGMSPGGTLTLSAPLPANAVNYDFGPNITALALTDGVRTYNLGASTNIYQATATTDAGGNVTNFFIRVQRIIGPPYPTNTPADPNSRISTLRIDINDADTINNRTCATRGAGSSAASLSAAAGSCSVLAAPDGNESTASVVSPFSFVVAAPPPPPATVPTLSEWAMILFGLLLAGGAAVHVQRRRAAQEF